MGLWAYGPVSLWVVGFEHNIYHVCSTKCGPVDCGLVDLWICGSVELWSCGAVGCGRHVYPVCSKKCGPVGCEKNAYNICSTRRGFT